MKRRLVLAALTLLTSLWGEARAVTLDEIAAVAAKTPSFAADFKMVKKNALGAGAFNEHRTRDGCGKHGASLAHRDAF